jgi:phenylalanyl-tRNA synthetase alpha chain
MNQAQPPHQTHPAHPPHTADRRPVDPGEVRGPAGPRSAGGPQPPRGQRARDAAPRIDPSLPGRGVHLGRLHPLTRLRRRLETIFLSLGFSLVEGPEVEWEAYNFTHLNFPPDHPARDMHDTVYVAGDRERPDGAGTGRQLLRTHTSPVQVRVLETRAPPIRVITFGRVYRAEATDARSEAQFSHMEVLAVDEGTTMASLKGVVRHVLTTVLGGEVELRFRCSYFPSVEPGAEVDVRCRVCGGRGCRVCEGTGWLEVLGCGMVHPSVLRHGGLDPRRFRGWALGMGVERLALTYYGVEDIRHFSRNDRRFLAQLP